MTVVIANIYQKEKGEITHGIHIKDQSQEATTEENLIWWLVVNIIRNHRISFVTTEGFKLDKKICISASVYRDNREKKYHYFFSKADEVDKTFKYRGEMYMIRNAEINTEISNNLTPVLDTIAFSTIEKNRNFDFLINVPMQS